MLSKFLLYLLLFATFLLPVAIVAANHKVRAVFKRNFASYFSGALGYLFIVVFVGVGAYWAFTPIFFAHNLANLDQLTEFFPRLLLFIIPAITMTSWADERRAGTDELLFTLPATDLEILFGKFLSMVAIYAVALLNSMIFCACAVLLYLTSGGLGGGGLIDFDFGLILTNYLGYFLAGVALIAAGMFASFLTNSTSVAFIIAALLCAIPVFMDYAGSFFGFLSGWVLDLAKSREVLTPITRFFEWLSVSEQLRDFGLGLIPLAGIVYFLSLAGLFLYLNLVVITRRHWAGGPQGASMGLQFLVRTVALFVTLVSLNVVVSGANARIDLTSEKLYSVFPSTRDTIQRIPKDRLVTIQAFVSPDVPRDYVVTRMNLVGLLREYQQLGAGRIDIRIENTDEFSVAAEEAKRYGIEPQMIPTQVDGRWQQQPVFLGAVVSSGADDEVVIPFFDVGIPVEYELTRSIQTILQEKRLKVGVLTTDVKLFGGFDMQTFQQSREWRIVTELKKQYDVEQVAPDAPITGEYDVLIAAMPSSLTDPQLTNLTDYVKSGKPTLIFDDPFTMFNPRLSPRQQKPSAGGGMMGHGGPSQPKADDGKATRLLKELGLAWENGEVVWDDYNPHPEFADGIQPEIVFIGEHSGSSAPFSSKSPITSGMQELVMLFAGRLRPRDDSQLEFIPLLRTAKHSSGLLQWEDLIDDSFSMFGGGIRLKPDAIHEPGDSEHVLAAHIHSKSQDVEGKVKGINVVFVADMDMISDMFFNIRDKQLSNLKLDNVTFVLDAVDVLAGKPDLVELRKRRARHHTLKRIESIRETQYQQIKKEIKQAEDDAKNQLQAAKKRFEDKRQQINEDKSLDRETKRIRLETVLQEEQRRLEVEEANINTGKKQRIEKYKNEAERKIRSIEQSVQIWAVLLTPIPALLAALFVFFTRLQAERLTVNPERLAKR